MKPVRHLPSIIFPALLVLLAIFIATGCYTSLENPDRNKTGTKNNRPNGNLELPPGHRPIDEIFEEQESWAGRSILDEMVGEGEPIRFENLRRNTKIMLPSEHAEFTLRIVLGSSAYNDIWQIRVDEFGWVVGAHWVQTDVGPELDESNATRREEFRIDSGSEAALRAMVIALLPIDEFKGRSRTERIVSAPHLQNLPDEIWPHLDPGLIEISYSIEELGNPIPQEWPSGKLSVPAEIIQLLICTWETPPPYELQDLVWAAVDREPILLDLALVVEAMVLAWQVESEMSDSIQLPLWVLR